MEKKRVAILSGGGSNGDELAGSFIESRKMYDVYILNSTGSLQGILFACGKFEEAVKGYTEINNRKVYGWLSPFNKNGKPSWRMAIAASKLLISRKSLHIYSIDKYLEKQVREYFKKKDFDKLLDDGIEVIVTVKNIDYKNRETDYISNRSVNYNEFVNAICASFSIPMFAKPRIIGGARHVDGGWSDNIPTELINRRFKDYYVDVYLTHSKQDEKMILDPVEGILDYVIRYFLDSRFNNMRKNLLLLKSLKHERCRVFHSTYEKDNSANFDPEKMKRRVMNGRRKAQNGRMNPTFIKDLEI